jgi:hypothetical protein
MEDGGERRLTDLMEKHLSYAYETVAVMVRDRETELIRLLKPPLNLNKWPNPQRPVILQLLALCREEALAAIERMPSHHSDKS